MSLFRAVYFSIAVHVVFYLMIWLFPSTWVPDRPLVDVAEIEILQRPFEDNSKAQQVVRQAQVPEKMLLEDDSTARFLSQQRQRVMLETKARETGLTQNADNRRPQPRTPENQPPSRDLSGYEPVRLPRPNEILNDGHSTVGETLPNDVALGSFTALNTDRFQFYSFFSRIEELVRFRWETQVRQSIDSMDPNYVLKTVGSRSWITHVEFLISPESHLKISRVMKESGIKGFDEAAIWAFQDARFFPNPPPELVEDDGYIHLKYSFNVYFEPSAFSSAQ